MRQQLFQRWQDLARENRDFLDTTLPERIKTEPAFDFTKDEAYMARCAEMDALKVQIDALDAAEQRMSAFDTQPRTRQVTQIGNRANPDDGLAQYRALAQRMFAKGGYQPTDMDAEELRDFHNYLITGGRPQQRANLITTGTTTGGYGVPTAFSSMIIHDLDALESVRRAGASVMKIDGNTNLTSMAKVAGNFIAEAQAVTATDPTVGRVTLSPSLLICRTIGSWQFFNRFVADAGNEIRRAFAQGIAETEGSKFLTGAGTGSTPQGLTVGGTQGGATTASATAITAAELDALFYSMNPAYVGGASFWMNGTTAAMIRALESTNGMRLWVDNIANGVGTLYGRPVIIDPLMPAPTSTLRPIVFANVAAGYVIGEEEGLSVIVDPYTQLGTGETQIAMYKFVDGRVKDSAAVKYLLMKT